jgi:hypothetical protein
MVSKNEEAIQSQEKLSSDVVALCALLARIMMRCLREKNPRILGLISEN